MGTFNDPCCSVDQIRLDHLLRINLAFEDMGRALIILDSRALDSSQVVDTAMEAPMIFIFSQKSDARFFGLDYDYG